MTVPVPNFDLNNLWENETRDHLNTAQMTFATLAPVFCLWLNQAAMTVRMGGKILFFGNGGSAGDAQHLATELAVRFIKDRPAIPALALTTDTSALTAIGNDLGFDHLFSRQIDALGSKGDMAVGISTSGNSPNVLKALWTARDKGLVTVGLTGRDGGKLHDCCDIMIVVPSDVTARIQEMHITLGHMFCGGLEQSLGLVA